LTSRRSLPGRAEIERARALLVEVAASDPTGALGRGLARFGSWRSLAAIVGTGWLPLPRRPSPATARLLRQRLRALGAEPRPATGSPTAAELPDDQPIQLRGTCVRLPGAWGQGQVRGDDLWRASVVEDETGRWAVEEGEDFVLHDPGGRPTLVLAEGGRLVNAERLTEGDEVALFGLAGEAPDRAGIAGAAYGRGGGLCATLRSGSRHPLLVSVIRRYDQEDDAPQD
jgi:hypothetical protein